MFNFPGIKAAEILKPYFIEYQNISFIIYSISGLREEVLFRANTVLELSDLTNTWQPTHR
jgi:23S rRNA pseudoU1915 N3-methylase RlmH